MQRGRIFKQRKSWTLSYYDTVYRGGQKKRVRVSKKLATISKDYPTKASVRVLADSILAPLNRKDLSPESSMLVTDYIEQHYFPAVEKRLRPSTFSNYRDAIYKPHLKNRLKIRLRDFRTVHAQRILRDLPGLSHRTLLHFKSFLSGVFRHAKQEGVLDGQNPVADATVPPRRPDEKPFRGVAYTIEDVDRLLEDLQNDGERGGDPAKLLTACEVIALLSFTGLRQGEARGLRWKDWNEPTQTLEISRAVWGTKVGATKNTASAASIPVLPLLRELLERRRDRVKPSLVDYVFAGERRGEPLNFHNLEMRVIAPALKRAIKYPDDDFRWSGFHGFRRGLASNLFALGVSPVIVAAMLRHSDVTTTLQWYIKTPEADVRAAMDKLEERIRHNGKSK